MDNYPYKSGVVLYFFLNMCTSSGERWHAHDIIFEGLKVDHYMQNDHTTTLLDRQGLDNCSDNYIIRLSRIRQLFIQLYC